MATAPTTSIADYVVTLTFNPDDPTGCTAVEISPDCALGYTDVLRLLADCIDRLTAYRDGWLVGMSEDCTGVPIGL